MIHVTYVTECKETRNVLRFRHIKHYKSQCVHILKYYSQVQIDKKKQKIPRQVVEDENPLIKWA